MMVWIGVAGVLIIAALSVYAYRLTRAVHAQTEAKRAAKAQTVEGIQVLIGSYLDQQVDRAECILRIRVLLDAGRPAWREGLSLPALLSVSDALLAMPFGQARASLDNASRQAQDATRRQLLQLHEAELTVELKQLKEWITP